MDRIAFDLFYILVVMAFVKTNISKKNESLVKLQY